MITLQLLQEGENERWFQESLFLITWLGSTGVYFRSKYISRNVVFQVQEETWLEYQEIKGTLLCGRGCLEEAVSWTLELILSSGTMEHSEVDVDFAVHPSFLELGYWL